MENMRIRPRWGCIRAVSALVAFAGSPFISGPASALGAVPSFHTPSGNIGCSAFSGYLRCDIAVKSWHGPARPPTCPLVYGDSFTLNRTGRPIWTCHGDTVLRSGRVLAYGATWRAGPFACTSRSTGLTCTNRRGHGFFLSRGSYRTF
jgi:hypothetical protein